LEPSPENLIELPATPRVLEAFGDSALTPAFSRRDPTFAPAAIPQSTLALELAAQYLRVGVATAGQFRLLEEFVLDGSPGTEEPSVHDVRHLMSNHNVLTRNFWKAVRVVVNNQSFTLVPEPLFKKEYAPRYLELARGGALTQEKVHFTRHPHWQAVTVFSLPARLDDWLLGVYPFEALHLSHQLDTQLTMAASLATGAAATGRHLLLSIEKRSVGLVLLDDGHLCYANRFAYQATIDLVYYVLFVLNELKINPADLGGQAWGQITPDGEVYRELVGYLPRLRVGEVPLPIEPSGAFADVSLNQYANLLRLLSD